MGLFAWRRRQEREAASKEAASFSIAEIAPKLDLAEPAPKKRRTTKPKTEAVNGNYD